jgi:hypothetical protein
MLEGLDDINWKELQHAYGSASDVPELLRRLCVKSDDAKEGAQYQLFGNIWHQHTVYEATPYAVPFLIEIASLKSTPDRENVLCLIAAIADAHDSYPDDTPRQDSRRAVKEHIDSLVKLMRDPTPRVRLAAAHAVAMFPEERERIEPELMNLYETEQSDLYKAGSLYLLGNLESLSDSAINVLLKVGENGSSREKTAAHVALAKLRLDNLPEHAKEWLIELVAAEYITKEFTDLPWDIESEVYRGTLITSLDEPMKQECLKRLLKKIKDGEGNHNRVATLLDLTFGENGALLGKQGAERVSSAYELSELQREVLFELLYIIDVPDEDRIFYSRLSHWNLPPTAQEIRDLLSGKRLKERRSWFDTFFK